MRIRTLALIPLAVAALAACRDTGTGVEPAAAPALATNTCLTWIEGPSSISSGTSPYYKAKTSGCPTATGYDWMIGGATLLSDGSSVTQFSTPSTTQCVQLGVTITFSGGTTQYAEKMIRVNGFSGECLYYY